MTDWDCRGSWSSRMRLLFILPNLAQKWCWFGMRKEMIIVAWNEQRDSKKIFIHDTLSKSPHYLQRYYVIATAFNQLKQ